MKFKKKQKKHRELGVLLNLIKSEGFKCSHGINYLLPCKECGKVLASILLNKPIEKKPKVPLKNRIQYCHFCHKKHFTWNCPNRMENLRDNILKAYGFRQNDNKGGEK